MLSFEYEIVESDGFFWAVVYTRDSRGALRFYLRRRAENKDDAERIGDEAISVLTEKNEQEAL